MGQPGPDAGGLLLPGVCVCVCVRVRVRVRARVRARVCVNGTAILDPDVPIIFFGITPFFPYSTEKPHLRLDETFRRGFLVLYSTQVAVESCSEWEGPQTCGSPGQEPSFCYPQSPGISMLGFPSVCLWGTTYIHTDVVHCILLHRIALTQGSEQSD